MEYIKYKKIIDISKSVITGKTPSTKDEDNFSGEYPFITPTDIPTYYEKYITKTERGISVKGSKSLKGYILPKNSICVVCIGSTIGKMCFTTTNSYTNQQINSIIPKNEYNPHYLFYLIRYFKGYFQLIGSGTGSGKGIVNKTTFSKIKLPIIDNIKTQTKIASILSAYDDLIEKNNRRMEILRGSAEELYKEWFVRFRFPNHQNTKFINGIPQGWGYGKIGDLCKIKNGFAFSSSDFLDKGDFGIIKIENVLFGDIQINKCQYVSDIDENKLKSFRLHSNDILIAMTGAQIGKTGRFPVTDKIFYLNQRVGKFVPNNPNIINNHYLYQYTQTKAFITFIENYANGAAQPNISGKQIENIKILIPANKLLQEYELKVDNILNSIQLLKNQNELLKQQRDLLLPRLMSGKINLNMQKQ